MSDPEVVRGVSLINRYRPPDGAGSGRWHGRVLLENFEITSRACRQLMGGICYRCPDCACATRALEQTNLEADALQPRQSAVRRTRSPKPPDPEPQPPPPRKRPAMVMPRPEPPVFTNAVARDLETHRKIQKKNWAGGKS